MSELHSAKRRKVRKGTRNCWECRRRKVRCIFSNLETLVCDNCIRRKTSCVSQELTDGPLTLSLDDERVDRVNDSVGEPNSTEDNLYGERTNFLTPVSLRTSEENSDTIQPHLSPSSIFSVPLQQYPSAGHPSHPFRYAELNRKLIAVWPTQNELELICALPAGLSLHLHYGLCRPCSAYDSSSPADILRLPPPGSHPLLLARSLLTLGTFIQALLPSSVKTMEGRGFYPREVMHRVVDTATRLVTTQDHLIGWVEAVECILLEVMYHNYAGNLHRAWLAVRRAITVAQLMALHRGLNSSSAKFLEPDAQLDLDHLTFRLAEIDAYLSLMLGLQKASLETSRVISLAALNACGPTERMQRLHYIVQERLLTRKPYDLIETHEIDKLIQQATAHMEPQWWVTPTFEGHDAADTVKLSNDMVRLMDQFVHFHLLIRLHLPYLLCSSTNHEYDYSKVIAVNASREILSRFLAFRASSSAHYYCRGSHFLSFIASTVLCIAHCSNVCNGASPSPTGFEFLAHSRASDRGLMERTLEIIETENVPSTDAIAGRISRILRDLLVVEATASKGAHYSTTSTDACNDDDGVGCDTRPDGDQALQVYIPHFGSIRFERGNFTRTDIAMRTNVPDTENPSSAAQPSSNSRTALLVSHTISSESPRPSYQALEKTTTAQRLPPNAQSTNTDIDEASHWYPPAYSQEGFSWAEHDDWDMQGIDVALFDSLFSGVDMFHDL